MGTNEITLAFLLIILVSGMGVVSSADFDFDTPSCQNNNPFPYPGNCLMTPEGYEANGTACYYDRCCCYYGDCCSDHIYWCGEYCNYCSEGSVGSRAMGVVCPCPDGQVRNADGECPEEESIKVYLDPKYIVDTERYRGFTPDKITPFDDIICKAPIEFVGASGRLLTVDDSGEWDMLITSGNFDANGQ
jgi:hypothetical protein